MDIPLENLCISDCLNGNSWNLNSLLLIFGDNINLTLIKSKRIIADSNNLWVWLPQSYKLTIPSKVYHHLCNGDAYSDSWEGWAILWHLNIAPKVKHFIWLLLHNAIKTHEFLYRLNLGPRSFLWFL